MQQNVVALPPSMSTPPVGAVVPAPQVGAFPVVDCTYMADLALLTPPVLQLAPRASVDEVAPVQPVALYTFTTPSVGHVIDPHVQPQPRLSSTAPTTKVFVKSVVPPGGQV
jgi:hypothetical protein